MKKPAFFFAIILPFFSSAFQVETSVNKEDCSYEVNEIDKFTGQKKIVTSIYNLAPSEHLGELSVKLSRSGFFIINTF